MLSKTRTAMQGLEKDVRREFDQAIQSAPELVSRETQFIDFLKTDFFDASKAALRLARYWKFRKQLFEERWLLPMDQTGRGAMSPDDIFALRSGYVVVHLRPQQQGGAILLVDMARLPVPGGDVTRRCLMYLATIFAHAFSQPEGVTVVYAISS